MRKSIVKKIFFSLEPLVRPKSALYALKEVPKRDDGDPRPFIWVSSREEGRVFPSR